MARRRTDFIFAFSITSRDNLVVWEWTKTVDKTLHSPGASTSRHRQGFAGHEVGPVTPKPAISSRHTAPG